MTNTAEKNAENNDRYVRVWFCKITNEEELEDNLSAIRSLLENALLNRNFSKVELFFKEKDYPLK